MLIERLQKKNQMIAERIIWRYIALWNGNDGVLCQSLQGKQ